MHVASQTGPSSRTPYLGQLVGPIRVTRNFEFLSYARSVCANVSDEQWSTIRTDLHRWAKSKWHPEVEPDDIAQEGAFRAFRWSRQTGKSFEEVRAYAFACAKNWLIDQSQLAGLRFEKELHDEQVVNELPEDDFTNDLARRLTTDDALQSLDDLGRDMLYLHFVLGFDYREIGQILGAKESTIRMRAKRALEKLRRELGEGDDSD